MELKEATIATLTELWNADWFGEVGKPLELEPDVKGRIHLCKTWEEATKYCSEISWENVQIEASNSLRRKVISVSTERFKAWNEVARRVIPVARKLVTEKTFSLTESNHLPEEFEQRVRWDIIHLLLEAEYSDIVPPSFFAAQSYWYVIGRFPCGWKGNFPNGKLIIF